MDNINNDHNGTDGTKGTKGTNTIHVPNFESVSREFVTKLAFIHSALEKGWSVKKNKDSYVFTKKHEGKTEMFSDSYLSTFVKDHSNITHPLF